MRYRNIFGIAALVATALSALAASSAVAGTTLPKTVFCENDETVCGHQLPPPIVIALTLEAGTKSKLKAGFAVIECAKSSLGGTVTWSEENHTPHGVLTEETFGECNAGQTVTVKEKAEVLFHHEEPGPNTGAITILGGTILVTVGSTSCAYGGTVAGSRVHLQGGSPAVATASKEAGETKLTKVEGGILCASPAEWIASYRVAAPNPLRISTTP